MKTANVDLLNTGLIFISFLLAYWLPFELFIFAYAVLGPLHYLTEINWIRGKKYFIASKLWIYLVVIAALLVSLPPLIPTVIRIKGWWDQNRTVACISNRVEILNNIGVSPIERMQRNVSHDDLSLMWSRF